MDYSLKENFIIAVDVGTSNLKCHLYSKRMDIVSANCTKIDVIYSDAAVEVNPDSLWKLVVQNVKKLISEANIHVSQVVAFAISSQRGTFTLWDRQNGKLLLNLITWKDLRAVNEISAWNNSWFLKILKFIFHCLYWISGNQRFHVGSKLQFTSSQVTMKLLWVLRNTEQLKTFAKNDSVMFGTMDTWLLYRLTNGKSYCSDYSCASATGMFDPFTLTWTFLLKLFGIPTSILPPVVDTAGTYFGCVSSEIWGAEIPIYCCMADQSASTFGLGCINRGDLKLTLGTGGFFSIIVGRTITSCKNGKFYPLICWKYKNDQVCALESAFDNCGIVIEWAHRAGFFDNIEDLSMIAESVPDSNGIYLKMSYFESQTSPQQQKMLFKYDLLNSMFVGVSTATRKAYIIRAILESIVFQIYHLFLMYEAELQFIYQSTIRINGGVSNNDFICQSVANICRANVSRPFCVEASVRGAALLAGISAGLFNVDTIVQPGDQIFHPSDREGQILRSRFVEWAKHQT